jgi:hypothetical protein
MLLAGFRTVENHPFLRKISQSNNISKYLYRCGQCFKSGYRSKSNLDSIEARDGPRINPGGPKQKNEETSCFDQCWGSEFGTGSGSAGSTCFLASWIHTVRTVAADLRRGEQIPKMQNNIGRKKYAPRVTLAKK